MSSDLVLTDSNDAMREMDHGESKGNIPEWMSASSPEKSWAQLNSKKCDSKLELTSRHFATSMWWKRCIKSSYDIQNVPSFFVNPPSPNFFRNDIVHLSELSEKSPFHSFFPHGFRILTSRTVVFCFLLSFSSSVLPVKNSVTFCCSFHSDLGNEEQVCSDSDGRFPWKVSWPVLS